MQKLQAGNGQENGEPEHEKSANLGSLNLLKISNKNYSNENSYLQLVLNYSSAAACVPQKIQNSFYLQY